MPFRLTRSERRALSVFVLLLLLSLVGYLLFS